MTEPIYATWMISNNIGDALTVWLIEKITGQTPIYVPHEIPFPKFMVCGSILNHATNYTTVWGAGLARADDIVERGVDIRCVRGPITSEIVRIQVGINVQDYGDPALLMPKYYWPDVTKQYKVGICPHYVHQAEVIQWLSGREDIKFLNVFCSPEQFVNDLLECEVVYSSSLHGLIIAHAYGVPTQWIEGTAKLGGDNTKFRDYLQSLLLAPRQPKEDEIYVPVTLHLQQLPKDINALYKNIKDNVLPKDQNAPPAEQMEKLCEVLWRTCPFKPEELEKEDENTAD
jgi:hypothetical protein